MRDSVALRKWLDIAVAGIRFGPDREAVKEELWAHLEDKTHDLQRIFPGMEEKEAQERALSDMGDAWELKASLAKIHRPWLGWLWMFSRGLVWVLLAVCLVLGVYSWRTDLRYEVRGNRIGRAVAQELFGDETPTGERPGLPRGWEGERLALLAPEAEGRLNQGTVSVPRAAWWRDRWWPEEGTEVLWLQVRVTWDRPWACGHSPWTQFWAEDDQGKKVKVFLNSGWEAGLSWRQWSLRFSGLSRDTKWVKLTYLPGTDFELLIDLTREVEG